MTLLFMPPKKGYIVSTIVSDYCLLRLDLDMFSIQGAAGKLSEIVFNTMGREKDILDISRF